MGLYCEFCCGDDHMSLICTFFTQIQAMARMWKARKAYRERLQFFGDHVSYGKNESSRVKSIKCCFAFISLFNRRRLML